MALSLYIFLFRLTVFIVIDIANSPASLQNLQVKRLFGKGESNLTMTASAAPVQPDLPEPSNN